MRNQFFCGDVIEVLKTFKDESIQMVVTSPPYWGQRDYEVDGQIGQESTPEEYIEKLVKVFREIKRVLRNDGIIWINLGDVYSSQGEPECEQTVHSEETYINRGAHGGKSRKPSGNLKPKDLVGLPFMLAFALRDDGWYWRQTLIWAKGCSGNYMGGSVMPESVKDRCTTSHEYILLFSKSQKYFYDSEAIKEPNVDPDRTNYTPGKETYKDGNVHDGSDRTRRNDGFQKYAEGAIPSGRNRRSVWVINPRPFRGAHFATFCSELILPCIKAGTSEYGCCAKCGMHLR